MKRLLVVLCALMFAAPVFGQRIKKGEPDMDGLMTLLGAAGYEFFSFDIPSAQNVKFEVREYVDGKESIIAEQEYDKEQYGVIKKAGVGFFTKDDPRRDDKNSVRYLQLSIPGASRNIPLKLRGHEVTESGKTLYMYSMRPFKLGKLAYGEFTPLIMFGSYWYDERSNVFRFCGESEISGLSSEILEKLPHYYVIGITVAKKN